MKGNETVGLSREFFNDGSDWAEISLLVQEPMNLDTEFLKHILDYCAKKEFRSLFSDETRIEEFEVCATKRKSESTFYKESIVRCGIEKIDGGEEVFALYVENLFDTDTDTATIR